MDDHISEPALVEGLPRAAVVKVLCGSMHTAAVTRAGQVFTWGSGESGALGHGAVLDRIRTRRCCVIFDYMYAQS
jgi:alpha-tubulin suppressor-like RCC1 family protein